MSELYGFDLWRNKNRYATLQEIDDRQSQDLLLLLHQWRDGKKEPWEVLLGFREALGISVDKERWAPCYTSTIKNNLTWVLGESVPCLNPKAVDRQKNDFYIKTNLTHLIDQIENNEVDSWTAAEAVIDFIALPDDADVYPEKSGWRLRNSLKRDLARAKEECEPLAHDTTMDTAMAFQPETEEQIKLALTCTFCSMEDYKEWREQQGLPKYHGWFFELWRNEYEEGGHSFKTPLSYPDRKLCREIHISPEGTGLIRPEPVDEEPDYADEIEYGGDVARITTYRISFVPMQEEDLPDLKKTLTDALNLLGYIPHKHWPAHKTDPQTYHRPEGSTYSNWREVSYTPYIQTEAGKAKLYHRLDLDDLWILYYLMEPVIEPSAQICAAMNGARYAEERGAPLSPDRNRDGFWEERSYDLVDPLGFMKDRPPQEILQNAMMDSFIELTLRRIDRAELGVRVGVLAHHTLSGRLRDAEGRLCTYETMIEEQTAKGNAVMSYNEAWQQRTEDLLRDFLGIDGAPSALSISDALTLAANEIGPRIRAQYRQQDLEDLQASREDAEQRYHRRNERLSALEILAIHYGANNEQWGNLYKNMTGKDPRYPTTKEQREQIKRFGFNKASSFDEASNPKEDEDKDGQKKDVASTAQLIVADSAVETCIDGIHAGGYISRTKNSPFVRKTLPKALEPFDQNRSHRPNPALFWAAPPSKETPSPP